MEFPKRKNLRLKNFDYSTGGYYFITICTHNRQELFGEIVGATLCGRPGEMIEKWLFKLQNKFNDVEITDYVIMPDHIHFIISKTGDHTGSPLRDMVGWFKTMTTNKYIRNVKNNEFQPFSKKIWQRGYYEHIIRDEQDYLTKARYIQNNIYKKTL